MAILGAVTTIDIDAVTIGPKRPIEDIADEVIRFVLDGVAA